MNKEVLIEALGRSGIQTNAVDAARQVPEGFIQGNRSNVRYFKDGLGIEVVVKEYPSWVGEEDISWIHEYMRQLAQKDFPLAKVLGEAVGKDSHYYGVYEFASGSLFDQENQFHITSFAKVLRKLHDSSRNIKISGTRNWPTVYGYDPTQSKLVSFDTENSRKLLQPAWKMADSLLQGRAVATIPIHGDFRRDNVRFDQLGVTKVFDFGNSRNDYAEVDLAITLRDVGENTIVNPVEFLKTYQGSGVGKTDILPEVICASALILPIQECLYLWRENCKNPSSELGTALADEVKHLESVITEIPQNLSLYREIFS